MASSLTLGKTQLIYKGIQNLWKPSDPLILWLHLLLLSTSPTHFHDISLLAFPQTHQA